jgi:putative hemolysin
MILLILLLVLLLSVSGFISASETSLFSLTSMQLKQFKQSGRPRLELIYRLMERPRDVLVTLLILNVIANILVQNTVSSLFDQFDDWSLKVGIPLVLTLIFGDVLPKSIALPNNRSFAHAVSPWVSKLSRWLGPVRKMLTSLTSFISRILFASFPEESKGGVEELRFVLKNSLAKGVLLESECRLVNGALNLQEELAREKMRPREEILYYDLQEPISQLVDLFARQQATRIPVCEGGIENLIGILSARRFFLEKPKNSCEIKKNLKKPYFVPETTRAFHLLNTMREKSESLAIVVDQYGSISGLITQEDLIEGVVGEIADQRDDKSLYTRSSENELIASGKLELSQFQDIFGIELESKIGVVTLGGWLIEQLGEIPKAGVKFETNQFLFHVLAAEPNRIKRIYIRRLGLKK